MLTRTCCLANSSATDLVRPTTPCLAAHCDVQFGKPTRPVAAATLTIEPPPDFSMCGIAYFMASQVPFRFDVEVQVPGRFGLV